jgi:hypothetical protein
MSCTTKVWRLVAAATVIAALAVAVPATSLAGGAGGGPGPTAATR